MQCPESEAPSQKNQVLGWGVNTGHMGVTHGTVDLFYESRINSPCFYLTIVALGPLLLMHNEA